MPDFIRRLEQLFKLAYGRDGMSEETRGTLLHSQAVKNEEKRLVELVKRRQYHRPSQALLTKRTTVPLAGMTLSSHTDQPKMQAQSSKRPKGDVKQ